MRYYRLYCVDRHDHFFRCEEIEAADDGAAIAEALSRRGEHAAELWEQGRKVKTFQKQQVTEPAFPLG
jgi:hypothetical protein